MFIKNLQTKFGQKQQNYHGTQGSPLLFDQKLPVRFESTRTSSASTMNTLHDLAFLQFPLGHPATAQMEVRY